MKKVDLGQSLQILGNIAVVIGMLLLVYELGLNRQMMRAQTRTDIAEGLTNFLVAIGSDSQITSVWYRGHDGVENISGEGLTEIEQSQYRTLMQAMFTYFENVHYQYRNGLYDETEFDAQRNAWRRLFQRKGLAEEWCRRRNERSPEFVAEIDSLLTTYKCD